MATWTQGRGKERIPRVAYEIKREDIFRVVKGVGFLQGAGYHTEREALLAAAAWNAVFGPLTAGKGVDNTDWLTVARHGEAFLAECRKAGLLDEKPKRRRIGAIPV